MCVYRILYNTYIYIIDITGMNIQYLCIPMARAPYTSLPWNGNNSALRGDRESAGRYNWYMALSCYPWGYVRQFHDVS